jgi:hypothetical protein
MLVVKFHSRKSLVDNPLRGVVRLLFECVSADYDLLIELIAKPQDSGLASLKFTKRLCAVPEGSSMIVIPQESGLTRGIHSPDDCDGIAPARSDQILQKSFNIAVLMHFQEIDPMSISVTICVEFQACKLKLLQIVDPAALKLLQGFCID